MPLCELLVLVALNMRPLVWGLQKKEREGACTLFTMSSLFLLVLNQVECIALSGASRNGDRLGLSKVRSNKGSGDMVVKSCRRGYYMSLWAGGGV